jgi:hypothetical protein
MPQVAIVGLLKLVAYVAVSYAMSEYQRSSVKRKEAQARARKPGPTLNYSGTDSPMPFVYGTVRAGGWDVIPPFSNGLHREYTYRVIAHSIGPVSDIKNVYLDDVTHQNSTFSTIVNSGFRTIYGTSNAFYYFEKSLGASSTAMSKLLVNDYFLVNSALENGFTSLFSSFYGNGIANTIHRYQLNADKNNWRGAPSTSVEIDGILCYDPRLDSTQTGGSGSHRVNDPSTWAFTKNVALESAHHLLHWAAGDYDSDEIDWESVMAAADICDTTVYVPSGTQALYTGNGILYAPQTAEEFADNMQQFAEAMMGRIVYTRGKWKIYAGAWETPTTTVTRSDFVSPPTIITDGGDVTRFNYLNAWLYLNSANYSKALISRTNSTYQVADGGMVPRKVELPLCVDRYEAQRKMEYKLRRTRNQIAVRGRLPPRFSDFGLYETCTYVDSANGWIAKTFRMEECTNHPDGSRDVMIVEEQSTDWTTVGTAEYAVDTSSFSLPDVNDMNLLSPSSLGIVPQAGYVSFFIGPNTLSQASMNYRLLRHTTNNVNSAVVVWQGAARHGDYTPSDPSTAYYWTQTALMTQASSLFFPNSSGVAAAPLFATAPGGLSVTANINGTLMFDITPASTFPYGSRYQIIRSTNSADASVGTVVWEGDVNQVPLVMPTSRHWYYSRARTNSFFSAYIPNTFGISAGAYAEATNAYARSPTHDPDIEFSSEFGEFWVPTSDSLAGVWSLSLTGGTANGRIIISCSTLIPGRSMTLVAVPKSPYSRARGGDFRGYLSARVTSYATGSNTTNFLSDSIAIRLYGWTGVGSPAFANGNIYSADFGTPLFESLVAMRPFGGNSVDVSAYGFDISHTNSDWRSGTAVRTLHTNQNSPGLGLLNTTSYPYFVANLVVFQNSFLGVIEIDRASVDPA